jgi:hypothetical protein
MYFFISFYLTALESKLTNPEYGIVSLDVVYVDQKSNVTLDYKGTDQSDSG